MIIDIFTKNKQLKSVKFLKDFLSLHNLNITCDLNQIRRDSNLIINRNHGHDYDDSDLEFLKNNNFKTLNHINSLRLGRDKYLQYEYLNSLGFKTLETKTSPLYSFPQVLKTQRGMQGRGVYLVERLGDIKSITQNNDHFIYQEFIEDIPEFRFTYFLGEKFILKKLGVNFKKNIFHGGRYNLVEPDIIMMKNLEKLHIYLKSNFYAIDFFLIKKDIYIFDINMTPGVLTLKEHLNPSKILKCQEFLSTL